MDPKIVLQALIRRLEGKYGAKTRLVDLAWDDEEVEDEEVDGEKVWQQQDAAALTGELEFAQALFDAKEALESGDEAWIRDAALICQGFERAGAARAAKHRVQSGGTRRGQQQVE